MKSLFIAAHMMQTLAAPAYAGPEHDLTPRHGGLVAEANHVEFELVAAADAIRLYARDHGKPLALAGASGRLTLLDGASVRDIALTAAGTHLEARGDFKLKPGNKVVARLERPGKKPLSVRFVVR